MGIVAILFLTVLVLKVEASDKASQIVAFLDDQSGFSIDMHQTEDIHKEEAIAYVNVIIGYIALSIFVYGLMIVLVCQTLFVACINRLNHNQLRLEAIFASGYQAPTAVNPTGVIYRQNNQLI